MNPFSACFFPLCLYFRKTQSNPVTTAKSNDQKAYVNNAFEPDFDASDKDIHKRKAKTSRPKRTRLDSESIISYSKSQKYLKSSGQFPGSRDFNEGNIDQSNNKVINFFQLQMEEMRKVTDTKEGLKQKLVDLNLNKKQDCKKTKKLKNQTEDQLTKITYKYNELRSTIKTFLKTNNNKQTTEEEISTLTDEQVKEKFCFSKKEIVDMFETKRNSGYFSLDIVTTYHIS